MRSILISDFGRRTNLVNISVRLCRGTKADGQMAKSTQAQILPPFELGSSDSEVWEPTQNGAEGDLPLYASEGGTEAKVSCPSKSKVPVIRSADIETIGVWESLGVTIRSCHHSNYSLPLSDEFSPEFTI